MTGILAAVTGGGSSIILASGLYGPNGQDLTPIDSSGNSPITINRTWIGYYIADQTTTRGFNVNATWTSNYNDGTQYSIAYLWVGATAKSGFNPGNANATANNNVGSYNLSVVAGTYYAIRLQWTANLTSGSYGTNFPFTPYSTTGAFSFTIGGSSTPPLYYNSVTNGF